MSGVVIVKNTAMTKIFLNLPSVMVDSRYDSLLSKRIVIF